MVQWLWCQTMHPVNVVLENKLLDTQFFESIGKLYAKNNTFMKNETIYSIVTGRIFGETKLIYISSMDQPKTVTKQ